MHRCSAFLIALLLGALPVNAAHAKGATVDKTDEARACKLPKAADLAPATTADLEQFDCYLDDFTAAADGANVVVSDEATSCPNEGSDDPPFENADRAAATLIAVVGVIRGSHADIYKALDAYLASKRQYYAAHRSGELKAKIDNQINSVATRLKTYRATERTFASDLEIAASRFSGHSCGVDPQPVLYGLNRLRIEDAPEVDRAADKLLDLVKLPQKKRGTHNHNPKPKKRSR